MAIHASVLIEILLHIENSVAEFSRHSVAYLF